MPMWSGFGECFCDAPAWGQQYSPDTVHAPVHWSQRDRHGFYLNPHLAPPYVPNLACKAHGGPGSHDIRFVRDGNMWCAFMPDFENLQESSAGFGITQQDAERDLFAARARDAKAMGAA